MNKFLYIALLLFLSQASLPSMRANSPYTSVLSPKDSMAFIILEKDRENVEALMIVCNTLTMRAEYDQVINLAQRLQDIGERDDNDRARLYGTLYKGKAYLLSDSRDSILRLYHTAEELAKKIGDKAALSSIYNGLGIYAIDVELDYYKGLAYYRQALEAAGSITENPEAYAVALNNTTMTYYLRGDTTGFKLAAEAYRLGHELDDHFLKFSGAFVTSYMYYLKGDYPQALKFIDDAVKDAPVYKIESEMYSLYGNILTAMGDEKQAEEYYLRALEYAEGSVANSEVMTYLSYGRFLIRQKRSHEAIPLLQKGLRVAQERKTAIHDYPLYQAISEAYEQQGDYRNALRYHRIFFHEADSVFNYDRERAINEIMIQYEAEKREKALQEKEIELLRESRKAQLLVFILVFIILTALTFYLLYRRKDKMLKQIVKQQHEFLNKEKVWEGIYTPSAPGVSTEQMPNKEETLFYRLEKLMREHRIYRDGELSLEKLSEMLDTNRTYLSRAISRFAGVNFYSYVNTYRTEEAVRILSTDNDKPLKVIASELGFNNLQTFYTYFKNKIGMPPSQYRQKHRELYSKKNLKEE